MAIGSNRAAVSRRAVSFCTIGALAPVLLCSGTVTQAIADAAIVIDASQTTSVSGGDDLAALQNIFQGANTPAEPFWEPAPTLLRPIITALKMKRMRLLQSDNTCDIDQTGTLGSVVVKTDSDDHAIIDPAYLPFQYYEFTPSDGSGQCNLVAWTLPWVTSYGLSTHVAIAQFLPPSFETYGAAETWSSKTYQPLGISVLDAYKSYARQLVRYFLDQSFKAGAQSVVFEVSNELDIADSEPLNWNSSNPANALLAPLRPWGRSLWWIDPQSFNLDGPPGFPGSYPFQMDPRRVQHGISPMQKIYADIISDIRAGNDVVLGHTYDGKTIEIAGPAFSTADFQVYPLSVDQFGRPKAPQTTLEELFLDQMLNPQVLGGQFNAAIDRFSFHYYGDFRNGYDPASGSGPCGSDASLPYTSLKFIICTIQTKLAALGHPGLPLFISEWGPTVDSAKMVINYSHAGAAWGAAFLKEALADGVTMGSYLTLSDAGGPEPTGDPNLQSLAHKLTDGTGVHYYPKPVANVFNMFAMMTGTRNPAVVSPAGGATNLDAFASSDAGSAHVVVWNYNSDLVFQNINGPDTPENFTVEIDNLFFGNNQPFSGTVTVQRYLVDATTSNLYAFLQSGSPPGTMLGPDLQTVESFTATVQDGRLMLQQPAQPSTTLGLGVTYWRISKISLLPPSAM